MDVFYSDGVFRPLKQPIDFNSQRGERAISIYKGFGCTFQEAFPRLLRDKWQLFLVGGRQDTKDDERREGGKMRLLGEWEDMGSEDDEGRIVIQEVENLANFWQVGKYRGCVYFKFYFVLFYFEFCGTAGWRWDGGRCKRSKEEGRILIFWKKAPPEPFIYGLAIL